MSDIFENWIRESAPRGKVNDLKKEIHLAVLKERLRGMDRRRSLRHQRQMRASMVATVVLSLLVGGNFSQLGSDGFDIIVNGPMPAFEHSLNSVSGLREMKVQVGSFDSPEVVLDLHQQIEGRIGRVVSLTAIEVQGAMNWTITMKHQAGDTKREYTTEVLDRRSKMSRAKAAFIREESDTMFRQVKNGILRPIMIRNEVVDGTRFLIKEYVYHSDKFGDVTYLFGVPSR